MKPGNFAKKMGACVLSGALAVALVPAVAFGATSHANQVHVIIKNDTFTKASQGVDSKAPAWTGTLVDTWTTLESSDTAVTETLEAAQTVGVTIDAPDTGWGPYITEVKGLKAGDAEASATSGGYTYNPSGWMGTINDWSVNLGLGNFKVSDGSLCAGDTICFQYSVTGGPDFGADRTVSSKTLRGISFSTGTLNTAFTPATKSYTLNVAYGTKGVVVTPTALNKNFQVRVKQDGKEYRYGAATVSVKNGASFSVTCGGEGWPGSDGSAEAASTYSFKVKVVGAPGTVFKAGSSAKTASYTINSDAKTVTYKAASTKAKKAKSITVPATVKYLGKSYKVTGVGAKAFKNAKKATSVTLGKNVKKLATKTFASSKVTKVTAKTKLITKSKAKKSLKSSKVKSVKVKVGSKSANKKTVKKYKKVFTKKNAGKKVVVR